MENFATRTRNGRIVPQSYCRPCHKEYRSAHYAKNRQRYINKAADYRREAKRKFVEWLMTQSCSDCGVSDYRVLEFDHVGLDKEFNVSTGVGSYSLDRMQTEIAKCEIVCANCHRIRTADRGGFYEYMRT